MTPDGSGTSRRRLLGGVAVAAAVALSGAPTAAAKPSASPTVPARMLNRSRLTRVVLLGTAGGPPWWPGTDRQGCSSTLVVGDRYYLIDVGYGFGPQLRKAKVGNLSDRDADPLVTLGGVFVTHLHSDHTVDLTNLLVLGAANGAMSAESPIPIYGPGPRGPLTPLFGPPPAPPVTAPDNPTPGTVETVAMIARAYATDINDRAMDQRQSPPSQTFRAYDVPVPEELTRDPDNDPCPRMSPIVVHEDDRVRVSATLVQHAPVFPALAYRFDTDHGSVVFSGDTGATPNLVELAYGADVLVHEVISKQWVHALFPVPRSDSDEALVQHLIRSHTTIEEVGPIADEADVPTLLLNHLVPANWHEKHFKKAQRNYSGRLIVGRDLDDIGVTPRS